MLSSKARYERLNVGEVKRSEIIDFTQDILQEHAFAEIRCSVTPIVRVVFVFVRMMSVSTI